MRIGKESTVMVVTVRGGNVFKRSITHDSSDLGDFERVGNRIGNDLSIMTSTLRMIYDRFPSGYLGAWNIGGSDLKCGGEECHIEKSWG